MQLHDTEYRTFASDNYAGALPEALRGARYDVVVDVPPDRLWESFKDIPWVAACVPGAATTSLHGGAA